MNPLKKVSGDEEKESPEDVFIGGYQDAITAGHFSGILFILFSLAKVLLLCTSAHVCAVLRLLSISSENRSSRAFSRNVVPSAFSAFKMESGGTPID